MSTSEKCNVCRLPATHKIGEEFSVLDPRSQGHNLTGYLCDEHFDMVIRPYVPKKPKGFTTGTRLTCLGLVEGFEGSLQIDHQTFYFSCQETKEHAEWMMKQLTVALNRLSSREQIEKLRESVKAMALHSSSSEVGLPNDYEHGKHTTANMILEEMKELWPEIKES
jgi:hypothetical protein